MLNKTTMFQIISAMRKDVQLRSTEGFSCEVLSGSEIIGTINGYKSDMVTEAHLELFLYQIFFEEIFIEDLQKNLASAKSCRSCGTKKSVVLSQAGWPELICHKCYQECSICGEYKLKKREQFRLRTNCVDCYNRPRSAIEQLREEKDLWYNSRLYKELNNQRRALESYFSASVSVKEMIAALKKLPKDARLYVSQEGYYAEGEVASAFTPQRHEEYKQLFCIGHSQQDY